MHQLQPHVKDMVRSN